MLGEYALQSLPYQPQKLLPVTMEARLSGQVDETPDANSLFKRNLSSNLSSIFKFKRKKIYSRSIVAIDARARVPFVRFEINVE